MNSRARYYRRIRRQGWCRDAARILASELPQAEVDLRLRVFALADRAPA